jgi:sugar/nucleoside kinase (ribokinase family)
VATGEGGSERGKRFFTAPAVGESSQRLHRSARIFKPVLFQILVLKVLAGGFLVADIVVADLERIASPGELVYAPRGIVLSIGGHPANVSVDLVKLGVQPDSIGVCGAVGNDFFGDFIVRTLGGYGLKLFIERVPASTNKNVILVVKGEDRRFHVELGASNLLKPETLVELAERERPGIFYLASGITDLVDARIGEVFERAARVSRITFSDSVQPHGKGWSYILPAFPHVAVFHCNESEAKGLTGAADLEGALRRLLGWGVKLALVTMGERGAVAANRRWVVEQPAFKVEVVDPTGAGDAFCAGVIWKLLELGFSAGELSEAGGEELAELLLYGQAAGASACTAPGTTEGVTKAKVEELVEGQSRSLLEKTRIRSFSR